MHRPGSRRAVPAVALLPSLLAALAPTARGLAAPPLRLAAAPGAQSLTEPVESEWCLLLTATVAPFLQIPKYTPQGPQTDVLARRRVYEHAVAGYAANTSLPIIFAENSGADLQSIIDKVPEERRRLFEFLSLQHGRHSKDIGAEEAQTILNAVGQSQLMKEMKCKKILKVTGRYFIHDIEFVLSHLAGCTPSTSLFLQEARGSRQETCALGFETSRAEAFFGWARGGEHCMECHVGQLARREEQHCYFPALAVDPVVEGSTQQQVSRLGQLPVDVEAQ